MTRTCGECTLCCKIVSVLELEKPAMTWCEHCDIGKGCRIYDSKPASCRSFDCLWLINDWLPPELRPDRCNIVFEGIYQTQVCLALQNEGHDDAHERQPANAFIRHMATVIGHSVVVFRYGKSHEPIIYLANNMTKEELVRQIEWGAEQNLKRFAEQEGISLGEAKSREAAFRSARELGIPVED